MNKLRISIGTACLAILLAACGGGDTDDSASATTEPAPGDNNMPVGGASSGATQPGAMQPGAMMPGASAGNPPANATTADPAGGGMMRPANEGAGANPEMPPANGEGTPPAMGTTTPPASGSDMPPASTDAPPAGSDAPPASTDTPPINTTPPTPVVRPSLVTSGPNSYWDVGEAVETDGNATITINEGETHQEWLGIGGTYNEAGWDALGVLTPEERDDAIRLLFDPTQGAGLDWGRIPMGSSDYAISRYSFSDTPDDWEMENFDISRDEEHMMPYIKASLAVNPDIRLWASPWSPPPWMKDSNDYNGGSMRNEPQVFEAYAKYFVKYIEAYAAEGITIEQVQPQNEPGYVTRYPSCSWGATDDNTGGSTYLGDFVANYLGPALEPLGTEIWYGTLSNANTYNAYISGATGAARQYLTGVGLQWNTMNNVGQLSGNGFLVMQTEHRCGNYPWEGGFNADQPPNDHAYALESWGYIRDWIKAGVHIYSAWNMILDTKGHNLDEERPWPQNALLVVDRASSTLRATPAYYAFRHVSQYVDMHATRVGVQGNADAIAFQNPDGSVVTIVHNSGGQASQMSVAALGKTLQFEVPGSGWATVVHE